MIIRLFLAAVWLLVPYPFGLWLFILVAMWHASVTRNVANSGWNEIGG